MKARFSRLECCCPEPSSLDSHQLRPHKTFTSWRRDVLSTLRDSDPLCQGKNCWLRQGVGGLIGTKSDHAIIVILDNRIVTKPHGRAFLQALPSCPVEII